MESRCTLMSGQSLLATLSLLLLLFSSSVVVHSEEPGGYAGWKRCGVCHSQAVADWQKSSHAKAFADLKKSGQENLPACVACHVTGSGQPGGFVDGEITPGLAGVQCEACHGPGKSHAASPATNALIKAPGIETCRRCHTMGQDPAFDYAKKIEGVHAAIEGPGKKADVSWLVARPDSFDFGSIDEGTPATTTVILENTGGREILITGLRTS